MKTFVSPSDFALRFEANTRRLPSERGSGVLALPMPQNCRSQRSRSVGIFGFG